MRVWSRYLHVIALGFRLSEEYLVVFGRATCHSWPRLARVTSYILHTHYFQHQILHTNYFRCQSGVFHYLHIKENIYLDFPIGT
jgi:hypothetical protein